MAAPTDFNVGAGVKAVRKLLKTYVDVSASSTPEWELLGKGVEDSSIQLNPSAETVTDVLGITTTDVTKWEPTQTFEPFTVRGGSKLAFKLHNIWANKTPELLAQFKVLIVYDYVDGSTTDTFDAELHEGCTIDITSIGGSAYVDMPIELHLSNNATRGAVSYDGTTGAPSFSS